MFLTWKKCNGKADDDGELHAPVLEAPDWCVLFEKVVFLCLRKGQSDDEDEDEAEAGVEQFCETFCTNLNF